MIAPALGPVVAPTIAASAVEMNRALPKPQPARSPMICSTLPAPAASAANSTTSSSPISRVRLTPTFEANQLVKNMAIAVMNR